MDVLSTIGEAGELCIIVNRFVPLPNPKHRASADRALLLLVLLVDDNFREFTTNGPPTYVDCRPHNVIFLRSSEIIIVGRL
jgi:hypothetical protein